MDNQYAFVVDTAYGEGFYMLELRDDAEAAENAMHNPGVKRVERLLSGEVVWPKPEHKQ